MMSGSLNQPRIDFAIELILLLKFVEVLDGGGDQVCKLIRVAVG